MEVQNLALVEMRGQGRATAVLGDSDAPFGPRFMSVPVRAIARCTGGRGKHREKLGEAFCRPTNQSFLHVCSKETSLGFFRITVLITDPGHSPIDVGRFR